MNSLMNTTAGNDIGEKTRGLCKLVAAMATFFMLCSAPSNLIAQPVSIGEVRSIYSDVLSEDRPVSVYLPDSYAYSAETRYPVLYSLDGEQHFKRVVGTVDWLAYNAAVIPEHIVVAIHNTTGNRNRDLALTQSETVRPDLFLEFIESELVPYIENNFRAAPYRILDSHSRGGAFALYAMLESPGLFGTYVAASPFLNSDADSLLETLASRLVTREPPITYLYLTLGNEPNLQTRFDRLLSILEESDSDWFAWDSQKHSDEVHMSTPGVTLHSALSWVYSDLRLSGADGLRLGGLAGIKAYYEDLSRNKYGYNALPSQSLINLAFATRRNGDVPGALEILREAAQTFPSSRFVLSTLSSFLEQDGQLASALEALETSLILAEQQGYLYLEDEQVRKQRLEERIANSRVN